ncbi:hypothetical protein C4J81_02490 [Deltaproteobacteria bacterium Smac51]|nr:hypothetical protein C4J81_02490 [Deltaproteobacteria bacterium Smac51]
MKNVIVWFSQSMDRLFNRLGLGMRSKLVIIFLLVKVIPLILLAAIAWRQFNTLGNILTDIAVEDSSAALNDSAVENIERMSTDTARRVADFLYERDDDILFLATKEPSEELYRQFVESRRGRVVKVGKWILAPDGQSWVPAEPSQPDLSGGVSTNVENNDMDGFNYRPPEPFDFISIPLYDEIAFVDLQGNEVIKVVASDSPKVNFPFSPEKKNVSDKQNTYIKAETYFDEVKELRPGEIYVSDVIGAYVGSNFIGMYTPDIVAKAAADRGYDIEYEPEEQSFAGKENPNGRRFEGIVRWASPVAGKDGEVIGYVTFALNHDHIMEFVDHITPMIERYTDLPSAFEGNYAFIWDYQCRNISHPRHNSIVGFDPETGDPQIPWLEASIYEGWQKSGLEKWTDYVKDYPTFFEQSRSKKPAAELTKRGLVGLDGRYLNNAPQCTGWMDLTGEGGSGSFYILWSGLYKLNTAAAIPYYTGHYAPSEANGYSKRGFGFVAIGSGLEDFTQPARETEDKLVQAIGESLSGTFFQLVATTIILIVLVVFIAIWMASFLTNSITKLIKGISRFKEGERQFRFHALNKDEFGTLADSFDEMADSLTNSVTAPLTITDMKRNVIYMNDYGLEICKKTLSDIVGTPYGDSSAYPSGSKYCPITALEQGREAEIMYAESINRYIKGQANYLYSKDGEKIGYIIETADVTEMVNKQMELQAAMDEARTANAHKGEFLARMSHEIRTPMNAIIGLSNIVQRNLEHVQSEDEDIVEIKNHIKQIESSSHHLLSLLNDILDLSKIEAGKIVLNMETVDMRVLANMVTSIIKPRCDEKSIIFKTYFDPLSPSTFKTDALRLRQVLINLLGNSVKFTPERGTVEFHILKKDRKDGKTLLQFIVRDTGIGISTDALDAVFQPFEQAGGHITRQYGGTGLGLTISRHIVGILGGDIEVKSEEGGGSEFSFSAWFTESDEVLPVEKAAADPGGKFEGKRVLLVDDVDLNRKVARAMLKNTGMIIDDAEDGTDAVQKFRGSAENTYDIILMDVQMPKMDGYQASRAIRSSDRSDSHTVPIVALTANAFHDDIEKAFSAGMNAHLAKPIKLNTLIDTLARFLSADK